MGKMNLLKSNYVGKVGATYGVEQYHNAYVKSVPFSHTPHNTAQRRAKDAFTILNRLSANIAKHFWKYLDLSDRTMYRNNAVSQWLKSLLVNNEFVLENISSVIPEDGSLIMKSFDYDYSSYFFQISLQNVADVADVQQEKVYISVITNKGVSKFTEVKSGENLFSSSFFDYIDFAYFQVLCFKSIPWYRKHKIKGLVLTDRVYVIIANHIFYVLRWSWTKKPYVLNHTLYLPADTVFIQNGIFYLR